MKNIHQATIPFFLLICLFCYQATAHSTADSTKTKNAKVTKIKTQIASMIDDSNTDFKINQRSASVGSFEESINKIKYYPSTTRFKGEVSLVRVEERNSVFYKSLIFGWKLESSTPKEVKEEAENTRKAALALIQEKVKSGDYKSYKVKTTDSSLRTELRDDMGNRIFEIVENQNYFHLIIFGNKWRTDTVDGLYSDFMIDEVLGQENKKRAQK